MNKTEEAKGIRKYIVYVHTRVKLIQSDILSVEDNQYYFYLELLDCINNFANNHKLWFRYMLGRCDHYYVMRMIGCETSRGTFRFLERQRKIFINYILEQETVLFAKYPFTGEYKWLHERRVYYEI